MHDLALGDPGAYAVAHRAFEDAPEPIGAPSLPDTRERRMIRQPAIEPEAREPADRQVYLRFPQEASVVDDSEQEACEHQADRGLRIDPRSTDAWCVEIGHLPAQPAKVENPVDAGEDVIVGDEVTQRSADEELELIAGPTADHATLHMMPPCRWNQQIAPFSTAPSGTSDGSRRTPGELPRAGPCDRRRSPASRRAGRGRRGCAGSPSRKSRLPKVLWLRRSPLCLNQWRINGSPSRLPSSFTATATITARLTVRACPPPVRGYARIPPSRTLR